MVIALNFFFRCYFIIILFYKQNNKVLEIEIHSLAKFMPRLLKKNKMLFFFFYSIFAAFFIR